MISELAELNNQEYRLLYAAPLLVSILIAGADNNIDKKEIEQTIKIAEEKSQNQRTYIVEFYKGVNLNFNQKLDELIAHYPTEARDRTPVISDDLAQLNPILAKLDKIFAIVLHQSLLQIARTIAKTSGGLIGINTIGKEEAPLINLPMLDDPSNMFGD